jgi:hypothetical protein
MLRVFYPGASEGKRNTAEDAGWRDLDEEWRAAWYGSRPRKAAQRLRENNPMSCESMWTAGTRDALSTSRLKSWNRQTNRL